MSEENVETVRAIFDLTRGDFSRWFDDVTDEPPVISWRPAPSGATSLDRGGRF